MDIFELFNKWPLPFRFDEMEIIGNTQFSVAVPENEDPEFKKYVYAAAMTYKLGNKSVDHILKYYGNDLDFKKEVINKDEKLIREITQLVRRNVWKELQRINDIENKPDRVGLFAAEAAMARLVNSFRSSILMIKEGMYFECYCINRLILEQLAWIYSIFDIEDESFFKIAPTKCISNLKTFIPFVGVLYGMLSKGAHISPEKTLEYILVKEDGLQIIITSTNLSISQAFCLVVLCDIFLLCSELIFNDLYMTLKYIKKDEQGNFVPNKDREMYHKIKMYHSKIFSENT